MRFKASGESLHHLELPRSGTAQRHLKVAPCRRSQPRKAAVFSFTWLSYTGSGMLIAAIISGFLMGFSPVRLVVDYGKTIWIVRLL